MEVFSEWIALSTGHYFNRIQQNLVKHLSGYFWEDS